MKGFTLVELLVSIAIFALMTALVVAKYGNFNQSVLLTNLAYDVALTIRTAQTYGLSVKNSSDATYTSSAYGVTIGTQVISCAGGTGNVNSQQFVMYADTGSVSSICDTTDTPISTFAIKRGGVVSGVCIGSPGACSFSTDGTLDISFKRPDPRATICMSGGNCTNTYAEIQLKAPDGSTRRVAIRNNGQISIVDY